jgi:hypothetical protein
MMTEERRWRKPTIAVALCCALLTLGAPARAAAALPDSLYGKQIVFSVWRSGSEIGRHIVDFARDGNTLRVESRLALVVRLVGIPVFRYDYDAKEDWQKGALAGLAVKINNDGSPIVIDAKRAGDKIDVVGTNGTFLIPDATMPTTHWDMRILKETEVLNTTSGKLDHVDVVKGEVEQVATANGKIEATHYTYTGDIQAEVWYDAEGHWVKLRFLGKDGTPVEYVCEVCTAPKS